MPFAVITGGSSGIGLSLARRLAARGFDLALVARGEARLDGAVAEVGARAVAIRVDVGEPGAGERIALAVRDAGRTAVDLLVCNAGIPGRLSAVTTDEQTARSVMDVNYIGMLSVTRALWPELRAARGRVVNVVSVAGTVALGASAPYAASKHAAIAWSRSLAATAPAEGVRVLTVNPGPVATEGFPQAKILADRRLRRFVITADACADAILHGLDHGRTEIFVPHWWRAAALVGALAPGTTARLAGRIKR